MKKIIPFFLVLIFLFQPVFSCADGLFGNVSTLWVQLPSLEYVTCCPADETADLPDGSSVETYKNVSSKQFDAFSEYLFDQGCELLDSSVKGSLFSADIACNGAQFSFSYDTVKKTAQAIYPPGTISEAAAAHGDETNIISDRQKELEELESELAELQIRFDAANTELENNQDVLMRLKKTIDAQTQYVADAQAELEKMQGQMEMIVGLRREIIDQIMAALDSVSGSISRVSIGENGNIILNNAVFFDIGKSRLKPQGCSVLDRLIGVLTGFLSDPEYSRYIDSIIISGHTDSSGTADLNRSLSIERANAVLSYMITGTSLTRYSDVFCAAGYGPSRPIAGNDTEYGRDLNRRIEISILMNYETVMDIINTCLEMELPDISLEEPDAAVASEEEEEELLLDPEVSPIEVDFEALRQRSEDVVAWLYCPDTVINYAVVQTDNNMFYLNRDIDGNYTPYGSLFVDCLCQKDFNSTNSIIYGHHMNDGRMFAKLVNYARQDYYQQHPIFYLNTPTMNYRVELFSGYITDMNSDTYNTSFATPEENQAWLDRVIAQSAFLSDVEVKPGDRILTLSTCTYEYDDARFVVLGKMIPIH